MYRTQMSGGMSAWVHEIESEGGKKERGERSAKHVKLRNSKLKKCTSSSVASAQALGIGTI